MRIFVNKIEAGQIKSKGNKRLVGLNVTSSDPNTQVEPVYLPLLRHEKIGNMHIIELSLRKPLLLVVLMPKSPFIHFEFPTGVSLDDE
jgi:hypothetical protein